MATFLKSANFNGSNGQYFELILEVGLMEQDTETNSSKVRYYLKMRSKEGRYGSGSASPGKINNEIVGNVSSIGANQTITVGTKDETIQHNEDGTKEVSYSASIETNWVGLGSASVSGTYNLPRIDRYPIITSAPDFNDEENPTITYTTALGFEGATVKCCIADATGNTIYVPYKDITQIISTGTYTFELTENEKNTLRNATPNSNILNVMFKLKTTTTDNTEYFSTSNKQMTIVNANPTFTYTEEEIDLKVVALLGSSGNTVIQNASTLRIVVSPTALKGSSITGVAITSHKAYSKTTPPYSFDMPIKQNTYAIRVYDSRENGTKQTITKTMIEYQPVDITNLSMKRVNPTSSNIRLNLEATYYQQTFGNTANVPTVKWKLNDGTYTTIPSSAYTIDTTNNKLTISNYIIQDALVYTSRGTFTISLEDLLTTDQDSRDVLKGIPTFDAGEHDLKVNGDLYVADTSGANKVNVLTLIGSKIGIEDIKLEEFESSATVSGNAMQEVNMGSVSIPTGYTLLGIIPRNNGYADQWVVSYSLYNDSVYAMIHSKYSGSLTSTLKCYVIYIKTDIFNEMLV